MAEDITNKGNGEGEGTPEGGGENTPKTYTAEEVEKMIQTAADKRVSEAMKTAARKKDAAVKEAEKLAQMDADEKYKYELEKREKALEEKEHKMALLENSNEAGKILADKGISVSLVDFVVAEDAETMKANIDLLEAEFKKSVKAEVEKRLASNTPKNNLPGDKGLTKESYLAMSFGDQQRLYSENPTLINNIMK